MHHFKSHTELYEQAFLALDSCKRIWSRCFSTNLFHLHCHSNGLSTSLPSPISCYISWNPEQIAQNYFSDDKKVYIIAGNQHHHVGNSSPIEQRNHKKADTREFSQHYLSFGVVNTGDIDVVAIFLSNFNHFSALNPAADIRISFKKVKIKGKTSHTKRSP